MSLHGPGSWLAPRELAPVLRMHGRVSDSQGSPLADARIATYYALGTGARSADDGRFELEVRSGQHMHLLRVQCKGYAEMREWVSETGSETSVDIELQVGAELRGHVRRPDGTNIVGVELRHGDCSALTDVDGSFAITDLPAGRQELRVKARGYAPRLQPIELISGEAHTDFTITLQRGHVLVGHLSDELGVPVRSALISARVEALDSASRSTFSDRQGRFRLPDLPGDTCSLEISGPGFVSVMVPVQLDCGEVEFELQHVAANTGSESAGIASR